VYIGVGTLVVIVIIVLIVLMLRRLSGRQCTHYREGDAAERLADG